MFAHNRFLNLVPLHEKASRRSLIMVPRCAAHFAQYLQLSKRLILPAQKNNSMKNEYQPSFLQLDVRTRTIYTVIRIIYK